MERQPSISFNTLAPTVKLVGQWLEWDADLRALLNEADTKQTITMPNIEGFEVEKKNALVKKLIAQRLKVLNHFVYGR